MQVVGFEMLDKLGEGGMATVWKARQVSLDRIVAIKVLASQFAADPDDVARFHSEAQSAAKLKHPAIVQVYDANMQEGFYYFVMEFIDGYTAGEWIQRSGTLSEKDALLVAECVAEALKHAWEKEGIIHCDIKPDNIMVDADGTVKVADLGLARTLSVMSGSSEEQAREILGTPAFMSPEQARGDVLLDCRSDIYSLGATLYYLVTGKLLFEGHTDEDIVDLQAEGTAEDPMVLNPRLSRGMGLLIESMLAKAPENRPKDWGATLQDIRRVRRRMSPQCLLKTGCASTVPPVRRRTDTPPSRTYALSEASPSSAWPKWALAGGAIAVLTALVVLLSRPSDPPPLPPVAWKNEPVTSHPAVNPVPATVSDTAAQDMFEFAKQWAEDNPDRYSDAIRKFQNVARQTRGTRYVLMANEEVARLNAERNKAVDHVMAELRQDADGLLNERRFLEAAERYRHYAGALSDETRVRRQRAVERLEALQREWDQGEEQRQAETERWLENAWTSVSHTLLTEGCVSALNVLDGFLTEPLSEDHERDLKAARAAIAASAGIDERIMNSFKPHVGQDVAVDLRSGRIQARLTSVAPEGIQGLETRRMGSGVIRSPVAFGVSDLAPREKLMRMGRDSDPGVPLAKGLLAYESNALDHARKYFGEAPAPLGERLLAAMDELSMAQQNRQAEQALTDLLRKFGVDADGAYDRDAWMDSVREKRFSADDIGTIRKEIQVYRDACGDTRFAQDAEPFLAELEALRAEAPVPDAPDARPDDEATGRARDLGLRPLQEPGPFKAVFDAVAKQNPMVDLNLEARAYVDSENRLRRMDVVSPQLESLTPFSALADARILHVGGVPFNQRHRSRPTASVSNLAPLKPLRLESLYVGQTSVKDLSPLEGMPLRELYAGGTLVDDLTPLRAMPLETLDIQRTAVRDLSPLRGLPLRVLNVSGASRLFDFRPLTGLSLRELDASSTQLRDIGFLNGMPLERLNLSGTRVHNFTMLRSLPLRHLDLSSTQIRDIELFRGQRLESLNLRDTGVNSVEVLRGMPLTSLTLAGTLVRDLSPLQNMPLTHLDVSGCRVDDIAGLAGLPLRSLNLEQTSVRDLSPLKDREIHYLNIGGTQVRDLNALKLFSVRHLSMRGVRADLTPLTETTLTALDMDDPGQHMHVLRRIRGLQRVNGMELPQLMESLRGDGRRPGRRR